MYELPDLFCELYDALERRTFRANIEAWSDSASLASSSDTIMREAQSGTLAPDTVRARISLIADNADVGIDGARYAMLRGLDAAFASINPQAPTTGLTLPPGLRMLAADAVIRGRYDSGVHAHGGALIPRLLPPVRVLELPDDPREALFAVLRVPAEDWDAHRLRVLPPDVLLHRQEVARGLRVGCAPFIADPQELRWESEQRKTRRFYQIAPRDLTVTRDRVRDVVYAFDDAAVSIGIVPELALTPALLAVWQQELATRRGHTALQWVLVGSGSLGSGRRPDNTAILLNARTGEEIGRQAKCFPFTMSSTELTRWKLEALLGTDQVEEDLEPGDGLTFLDAGGIRLAILVCEDLARAIDFGRAIRAFGATHLIVPVFARPAKDRRWERTKADQHCEATGSTVIVANSLITSAVALGRLPEASDKPGIGLVVTPIGGEATILRQADPAGIAAFTLHADGSVEYEPVS